MIVCHSLQPCLPPHTHIHTRAHTTAGQADNSGADQGEEAGAAGAGVGVRQQEQQQQQPSRRPRRAAADGAAAATIADAENSGDENAGRGQAKRKKGHNTVLPAEYTEASLSEEQRRFFRATNQQVRTHVFNSDSRLTCHYACHALKWD